MASLASLVPISERAGPKSTPSSPILWQPMQLTSGLRKTLAPLAGFPLSLTSSATGGRAAFWVWGRGRILAASDLILGQGAEWSAAVAVNFSEESILSS